MANTTLSARPVAAQLATASTVIIYDTNATATLASLKIAWTGAVPSTSASAAASDITYTSIGNSWYRVSFSFTTASSVSTHKVQYQPETTDTATQGIYAWGAQVEIGDTPTQYIPTTTGAVTETNYQTAGTTGKVYEVVTPYLTADLPQLKWTQSADVLTLTHTRAALSKRTPETIDDMSLDRAAVALILREGQAGLEIFFIERSRREAADSGGRRRRRAW